MIKLVTLVSTLAAAIFGLPTPGRTALTISPMEEPVAAAPAARALVPRSTMPDKPFEMIQDKVQESVSVEDVEDGVIAAAVETPAVEPASELTESSEELVEEPTPKKLRRRSRSSKRLRRRRSSRGLRRRLSRRLRRRRPSGLRRRASRSTRRRSSGLRRRSKSMY